MSDDQSNLKQAAQRQGSFLQTMKAVAWSFFGVRKKQDYQQDLSKLNPLHIVIGGVLGAVLLIIILLLVVQMVVAK